MLFVNYLSAGLHKLLIAMIGVNTGQHDAEDSGSKFVVLHLFKLAICVNIDNIEINRRTEGLYTPVGVVYYQICSLH